MSDFVEIFRDSSPEIGDICAALKALVIATHSAPVELVWPKQKIASFGLGPKKNSEHYVYVAPFKNHVNFGFYRGGRLSDPGGLLEGRGADMRHIKIRSVADIERAEIKALLDASIRECAERLSVPSPL